MSNIFPTVPRLFALSLALALSGPPSVEALAQECAAFEKAKAATMAASDEFAAHSMRFKTTPPQYNATACGAARNLKEQAARAAALATSACDASRSVEALNQIAAGADKVVALFCAVERSVSPRLPRAAIRQELTREAALPPPSPCRPFVGDWTSFWGDLIIRSDNTAFFAGVGLTVNMTCLGQSAIFHYYWLGESRDDQYDISSDGTLLTQITGAGFHVQFTRKSTAAEPGGGNGPGAK